MTRLFVFKVSIQIAAKILYVYENTDLHPVEKLCMILKFQSFFYWIKRGQSINHVDTLVKSQTP